MNKMKVVPVRVPWMISPSHDFAGFAGYEAKEVKVQALCGYNAVYFEKVIAELEQQYGEAIPDEEYNKAGSVMIEIKFTPIYLFNFYGKTENTEKYDFSILDPYYYGGLSLSEEWNKTGICPNPGFYEVPDSGLKEAFGFTAPKVKHWVLCGHDSCIDVLARTFKWREIDE